MIYVGIDITKLNHFAAAISSNGEIFIESFKFSNNYDGFYLLPSHLAPLDQNSVIIGLGSTAYYGDNLIRFLINEGSKVCVLSPIQTLSMRRSNVRKTKTDRINTFVIAKTLMMQDSLRFMALEDLDCIRLKELDRFRQELVKQRTRLKIQLASYVNQVFPELRYLFKPGLHQNSIYTTFEEAPIPDAIASMHLTYLTHTFEVASYDHFGKDEARELKVLAQKSVGVNDSSLPIQIAHTVGQIELLDSQLSSTKFEVASLVTYLHSVIMTIPEIGVVNDGVILGEISDIHRFPNPKKLLAFAGLNPAVYQSGNFQAHGTRMSRKGFKVLHYALMNAAYNAVKNNTTFKAYYDAKRAKGRTHYSTPGHCVDKLVRIIWKMLTDEVAFDLE